MANFWGLTLRDKLKLKTAAEGSERASGSSPIQAPLPTYADEAAAIAGGLEVGDFYKTAGGVVMITLGS